MQLQDLWTKQQTLEVGQIAAYSDLTRQIQIRLDDLGIPVGPADGIWGERTAWGLTRFCTAFKLPNRLAPQTVKELIQCRRLPYLGADNSTFEWALKQCLKYEGGFSDDPADAGGETNYGITHDEYDRYRESCNQATQNVRDISVDEVRSIYRNSYWSAASCPKLTDRLAIAVFDWSVNSGVDHGVRTLQQCLGIDDDGQFGPATEAAVRAAVATGSEGLTLKRYQDARADCYRRWGVGSQAVFLDGWLARCADLSQFLGLG